MEAVFYRHRDVAAPTHPVTYALNLNAGPAMPTSVTTAGDPPFWFLIDLAIARHQGHVLLGPPLTDIVGPIPEADIRTALVESLEWHAAHPESGSSAVLNACRAWHWSIYGVWLPKSYAGVWACQHGAPPVVGDAVASHEGRTRVPLDPAAVVDFLHAVASVARGQG